FGIESIPAVKAFRDGQLILEFEGALPEADLRRFLDQVCEGGAGADEDEGQEEADPVQAERAARERLKASPDDMQARVALARALLAQDRTDEVEEVLAPVGSSG